MQKNLAEIAKETLAVMIYLSGTFFMVLSRPEIQQPETEKCAPGKIIPRWAKFNWRVNKQNILCNKHIHI